MQNPLVATSAAQMYKRLLTRSPIDGFGTWLWALQEHHLLKQPIPNDWLAAADLVADYLGAL